MQLTTYLYELEPKCEYFFVLFFLPDVQSAIFDVDK